MIIVMGMPGSGKSTILSKANTEGYKILNFGDVMIDIAKKRFGITDRDEMRRRLTRRDYIVVQRNAAEIIGDAVRENGGKVILDTHAVVIIKDGYVPGLPRQVLSQFEADYLVFVTAPLDEIVKRTKNDATRVRDSLTREELERVKALSETLISSYAMYTGANVVFIDNREGKLYDAVEQLDRVVRLDSGAEKE